MILSVLFWCGILLLIDGSIGLFFLEKWQDKFKSINLSSWVCIEIIFIDCFVDYLWIIKNFSLIMLL